MDSLLTCETLDVRRGQATLVSGLSFGLDGGQMALIVGANGSGKTSLLRVLAGLSPPAAGRVTWKGTEIHRLAPEQRAELGYRGHFDGLKKDFSVAENLDFYARLGGGCGPYDELLASLSLQAVAHRQIRFLSAGQRRRAGLATLRVRSTALWILDEPMTNLDAEGRRLIGTWLKAHVEAGGLAVVATHQPDELLASGTLMIEL